MTKNKFSLSPHLPTSDVQKMVDFYAALGFSLKGEIATKDGVPVFAKLSSGSFQLRIELWDLPDWSALKSGFSVTTLWITTDSVASVADHLREQGIPFRGPDTEDYGSIEIELFDPEGFRIIYSEEVKEPVIEQPPDAVATGHTAQYSTLGRALGWALRSYQEVILAMETRGILEWGNSLNLEARRVTVVLLTAALCESIANTILSAKMTDSKWEKADHTPTVEKWTKLIPKTLELKNHSLSDELRADLEMLFVLRVSIVHAKPSLVVPEENKTRVIREGNGGLWDKLDHETVMRLSTVPVSLLDSLITDWNSPFYFIKASVQEDIDAVKLKQPSTKEPA